MRGRQRKKQKQAPATSPARTAPGDPATTEPARPGGGSADQATAAAGWLDHPISLYAFLTVLLLVMWILASKFPEERQLYVCLGIFSAIIAIAVHPALHGYRQDYPVLFDAALAMAGTFTGVIAGLYYTGLNQKVSENRQVQQLLLTADTNLDLVARHGMSFQEAMMDKKRYDLVANDPLPQPELLGSILSSELVVRNISPQSFAALVTVKNDTRRIADNVNNHRIPWEALQPHLTSYRQLLAYGRGVIEYELEFMNGRMTHEQLRGNLAHLIEQRQAQAPKELRPGMSIVRKGDDWKKVLKVGQ